MLLQIEQKHFEPDIVVLELKGKLAMGRESQQVENTVQKLLADSVKKVVLDLSGLDYIDSTGVGIVSYSFGKLKQSGGELRVAGATGVVRNVFKVTLLDTLVGFYPTLAEACANFKTPGPATTQ